MITRHSYIDPGYVCPDFHHEECKKLSPSWQHGNHGNEWVYTLKKLGEGGMVAVFYTPCKPDNIPEEHWPDRYRHPRYDDGFSLAFVQYHCPWVTSAEEILHPSKTQGCIYAEPCVSTRTLSSVVGHHKTLWELFDRTSFVQPEAFWKAFETAFEEEIAGAKTNRAEAGDLALEKCTKCDGHGVVKLEEPKRTCGASNGSGLTCGRKLGHDGEHMPMVFVPGRAT